MISMPDLFIFAQAFPGILVGFVNFPAGCIRIVIRRIIRVCLLAAFALMCLLDLRKTLLIIFQLCQIITVHIFLLVRSHSVIHIPDLLDRLLVALINILNINLPGSPAPQIMP